jgi:hypothetical protein
MSKFTKFMLILWGAWIAILIQAHKQRQAEKGANHEAQK